MVNATSLRNKIRKVIDDYGSDITINQVEFGFSSYGDKTSENLIFNCDSVANILATYGTTPTLDSATRKEGDYSIQGGTTITNQAYFGYSNQSLTSFDGSGKIVHIWVYVTDTTELKSTGAITFVLGNGVIQGGVQDPQKRVEFDRSELENGWNLLSFDVSNEGIESSGTFDETDITSFRINFYKVNSTDTITHGRVKFDYVYWEIPNEAVGIPYDIIAGRLNQVPAGNLEEGDMSILIKDNDAIAMVVGDSFALEFPISFGNRGSFRVTYKSNIYDLLSIKRLKLKEELLARELVLKRRI